MYKSALTISLSLLTSIVFSQNSNLDYKFGLKLYNMTSFEQSSKSIVLDTATGTSSEYTEKTLQILHPTIAFQWKSKKNNFHEVELTSLMFGKNNTKTEVVTNSTGNNQLISGGKESQVVVSMRYEFILNFNKTKEAKLVPSIGFGVNPYFKRNNFVPITANFFPSSDTYAGIKGFVTPRLTYFMTSKLFLDLNLPLCVVDSYLLTSNRLDPTVPVEENTARKFNFQSFPKQFSARIGIGLKL